MGETPTEVPADAGLLLRAICTGCKEPAIHKKLAEEIPDNTVELGATIKSPCAECGAVRHINITELVAVVDEPALGFSSTKVVFN